MQTLRDEARVQWLGYELNAEKSSPTACYLLDGCSCHGCEGVPGEKRRRNAEVSGPSKNSTNTRIFVR